MCACGREQSFGAEHSQASALQIAQFVGPEKATQFSLETTQLNSYGH